MDIEGIFLLLLLIFVYLLWLQSTFSKVSLSTCFSELNETIFGKETTTTTTTTIESSKCKNQSSANKTENKAVAIPVGSVLKDIYWFFTVGDRRPVTGLVHVLDRPRIFTLKLFSKSLIVVSDFQLGRELFKNPVFCVRPKSAFHACYSPGIYGIFGTSGKEFREQKKFCNMHLKSFGFGTKSMESYVQAEIDLMIESWSNHNGQVFSPNKSFYAPTLNTIWKILSGERVSGENHEFIDLILPVYRGFSEQYNFPEIFLQVWDWKRSTLHRLSTWTPFFPGVYRFRKSCEGLRGYFQKFLAARIEKLSLMEERSPETLVDAYLQEIKKTTDPTSEFYGEKGMEHLLAMMVEFFIAGGDTTSTTLIWAMLELVRSPEIQETISRELTAAVGLENGSSPCLQDRHKCPYTEAFIWEVLRHHPVAGVCVPHMVSEETVVGSYLFPKGAGVVLNIYGIQRDPNIWGDPEVFRPERFLSQSPDGIVTFVKHEAICAFSLGIRKCIGEQVAKETLFLFISSICFKFILKPDPALKEPPSLDDRRSFVHVPPSFNMVAIPRLK